MPRTCLVGDAVGEGALQARNSGSWGGDSALHSLALQRGEAWHLQAVLGSRSGLGADPRAFVQVGDFPELSP